jgi:hypothetical protein
MGALIYASPPRCTNNSAGCFPRANHGLTETVTTAEAETHRIFADMARLLEDSLHATAKYAAITYNDGFLERVGLIFSEGLDTNDGSPHGQVCLCLSQRKSPSNQARGRAYIY